MSTTSLGARDFLAARWRANAPVRLRRRAQSLSTHRLRRQGRSPAGSPPPITGVSSLDLTAAGSITSLLVAVLFSFRNGGEL